MHKVPLNIDAQIAGKIAFKVAYSAKGMAILRAILLLAKLPQTLPL